jgi:long-chain fatty acid transport protein
MNRVRTYLAIACVAAICLVDTNWIRAQGLMIPMHGPINRSMGGAATAAPLDAIGAIYWNPASISGLPQSELEFGFELVIPDLVTDSSIAGWGSGSTGAEPGVTPVPTIGWVHQAEDSCLTYGLGLIPVAGFKTNFPASLTNPILTPQPNAPGFPGGFGRVFTQAEFYEFLPTVSCAVTERLSIGGGPTVTMGELIVDPLVFAAPDDADGSFAARYPSGRGTRMAWGGGAQLGAYYIMDNGLHFGANIKTPQWMEEFRFFSEDELGRPRTEKVDFDLPMIFTLGTAYSGIDGVVLAVDLRYIDFKNTDGLGGEGFNADGSVKGLGWSSVFVVATGLQLKMTERLYLRGGYTYNQTPIHSADTTFAVGAPLYYQHEASIGGSWAICDNVWLNLAYTYFFEASATGPIVTPFGSVPGSSVTLHETVHVASLGVSVRY